MDKFGCVHNHEAILSHFSCVRNKKIKKKQGKAIQQSEWQCKVGVYRKNRFIQNIANVTIVNVNFNLRNRYKE